MPLHHEALQTPPRDLPGLLDTESKLAEAMEDPATLQFVSYYQNGFGKRLASLIDKSQALRERETPEAWFSLDGIPADDRDFVAANTGSIQLTQGCGGKCPECCVDAVPGVRMTVPTDMAIAFLRTYGHHLVRNKAILYHGSDPGDHSDYLKIHEFCERELGYSPFVSTVAPPGSEETIAALQASGERHVRLSIMPGRERNLRKRGLLALPNIFPHPVAVGNMSVRRTGESNEGREWESEAGTSCYYGFTLTPYGVYTTVPNPGLHPATPQKEFVIPFRGRSREMPAVGDDMRLLLTGHAPRYFDITDHFHTAADMFEAPPGTPELPSFMVIDDPRGNGLLAVGYCGVTVTHVERIEDFSVPDRDDPSRQRTVPERMAALRHFDLVTMVDRMQNDVAHGIATGRSREETDMYIRHNAEWVEARQRIHDDPVASAYLGLRSLYSNHVW